MDPNLRLFVLCKHGGWWSILCVLSRNWCSRHRSQNFRGEDRICILRIYTSVILTDMARYRQLIGGQFIQPAATTLFLVGCILCSCRTYILVLCDESFSGGYIIQLSQFFFFMLSPFAAIRHMFLILSLEVPLRQIIQETNTSGKHFSFINPRNWTLFAWVAQHILV